MESLFSSSRYMKDFRPFGLEIGESLQSKIRLLYLSDVQRVTRSITGKELPRTTDKDFKITTESGQGEEV